MAGITCFINSPIDVDSARICKAEAIAQGNGKNPKIREYVDACDDVIAGRALFADAFPHGAESTLMWLLHGRLTGVKRQNATLAT
jgi:hypothetical protein